MSLVWFVLGLLLSLIALWDAFETIVLPRTVQRRFRMTRFVIRGTWVSWALAARLPMTSRYRDTFIATYGPSLLLFLIVCWATSLILGFGLMLHGLAHGAAETQSLTDAIYLSGSVFFTLGVGDVFPVNHVSRVLCVIEAGTGFGFLAMVIGYLPIFYQAFSRREIAISLLDARAGSPPTAVEMLRRNSGERVAGQLLEQWEGWCSELLESHLSYPILSFFRSQHEKQSWLASLVVILDTSALLIVGLGELPQQQARFTFAMARHALVDMTQVFDGRPTEIQPPRLSHEGFALLSQRLSQSGYTFSDPTAEERLSQIRHVYEPMANALAQRLLIDLPPWIPAPDAEDDWQSSPWDSLPGI